MSIYLTINFLPGHYPFFMMDFFFLLCSILHVNNIIISYGLNGRFYIDGQ